MRSAYLAVVCLLAAGLAAAGEGAGWRLLRVPAYWEKRLGGQLGEYDGFAWYRCFVKVPAAWRGLRLRLELGKIDDCDETFFNEQKVGLSGALPPKHRTASGRHRRYTVAPQHVRAGAYNLIAVRVYDRGGGGGIYSGSPRLWCEKGLLDLRGNWHFRRGDDPAWAKWPVKPDSPEGRKLAESYHRTSGSAVGALQEFAMPVRTELPGTKPLTTPGDLAAQMVAGLRAHMRRRIEASAASRETLWRRDFSSPGAYVRSVAPNRERLKRYIGAVDRRRPVTGIELMGSTASPAKVAEGAGYAVYAARWPVLDGVDAEGLLLQPAKGPLVRVVAIPDADWTPEMLVGLAPGVPPEAQFARRLAESGCQVLVPVIIDRKTTWSGNPRIRRMTQQPHREWVYRMAYEMGRHIIGYEVQKVLAAVDWFARDAGSADPKIGVIGYGEGGLLALYAAAIDTRIDAVVVSGYFRSREQMWREPIYRNVWALLHEFGDAGVASLVAPRVLIIEASRGPAVGKQGSTPGKIASPPFEATRSEFEKVRAIYRKLKLEPAATLIGNGDGLPGREETLAEFFASVSSSARGLMPAGKPPTDARKPYDPRPRMKRQLDQLVAFTQRLMRLSEYKRAKFWSKANHSSLGAYKKSIERYREIFGKELLGELPPPSVPANPRTRLAYVEAKWLGYEVVLDVWPDVFAYGILLLPKDIKEGERRPVVVCQHGLEGRPQDVVDPRQQNCYHHFAAKLADRGFVVFAPQNLYIGGDNFRVLQRMANPLKCTLFSMIVRQHERILQWLAAQPFVDPARIAFYGLSYGGKTAMRVPPLLGRYCLSICSADFNEWVVKNVTIEAPYSYMFTGEYDMAEFDLGHRFNYAEMAGLIAPRPFMVERGHHDGVAPDEWVAYEYAKVRRLYTRLGIPERTEIEFFDGPHEIHGVGTFRFLHRHLNWPEPGRSGPQREGAPK